MCARGTKFKFKFCAVSSEYYNSIGRARGAASAALSCWLLGLPGCPAVWHGLPGRWGLLPAACLAGACCLAGPGRWGLPHRAGACAACLGSTPIQGQRNLCLVQSFMRIMLQSCIQCKHGCSQSN
eukprot:SAG31_NODE_243_length_19342_cov_12.906459_2_plen_125_part_00